MQAPVVVSVVYQVVCVKAETVVSRGHSYVVVSIARHPGMDRPATGKAYEEKYYVECGEGMESAGQKNSQSEQGQDLAAK